MNKHETTSSGVAQKIKRFFEPMFIDKKCFLQNVSMSLIRSFYSFVLVLVSKWFTNAIEIKSENSFTTILIGIGIFLIAYQFVNIAILFVRYTDYSVWKSMYRKYLKKYFYIDNNEIEKIGTGKMISLLQDGMAQRASLMNGVIIFLPMFLVSFISAIRVFSWLSRRYVAGLVLMLFLMSIVTFAMRKWSIKIAKQRDKAKADRTRHIVRILMSKYEIIQQNKGEKELSVLEEKLSLVEKMQRKKHWYDHFSFNIPQFFLDATKIVIMALVGRNIISKNSDFADLLLVIMMFSYVDSTFQQLKNLYEKMTKHFSSIEFMRDFFDNAPKMKWFRSPIKFHYQTGAINFDNVSFSYDQVSIFKNLSLSLQGGKKIALVGSSGAGKTTFMKLIAWYLHPTSWQISIDKQILPTSDRDENETVNLSSYYPHVAYLTQDPWVFDGTIYENLEYGLKVGWLSQKDRTERINQALKLAKCSFVFDFPLGLQTQIGERGVRLSGWQKQRLAIAKVFLKDPEIILLDEPTSALDSISEKEISAAFHTLFKGRTVIIIAHRLQTVKEADEILVFENWTIIERGIHTDLSTSWGIYQSMVELQSGFMV